MTYTLKELRAKNNMTQAETAQKLGVSPQTYNAWEKDFGKINIVKGNAIANLFGVTLDSIFFTPSHEKKSSKPY